MKTFALSCFVAWAATSAACDARFHLVGTRGALGDGAAPQGDTGGAAGGAPGASNTGGTFVDGGIAPSPEDAAVGTATTALAISAREAVTRVARVLWESPPDSALVAMADSGAVQTNADVRKLVLDMLADARARVGVAHFYHWWLGLDRMAFITKDAAVFPTFSADLGAMMVAETEAFGVDVTLNGDRRYPTLMQGSYSFLNQSLAALYGVAGVTGSDLRKVDLDPTQRAGILTQASLMTVNSTGSGWTSPTWRGILVVDKVLCGQIPAPPASVPPLTISTPPTPQTNRQRLEQEVAQCGASCHQLMDPLGFAYEKYDGLGRVRLTDSGLPIDASGRLPSVYGDPLPFNDAIDLAGIIAKLPAAHRCMGSKWLEYMLGRTLTAADGPSVTGIYDLFEASNLSLPSVIAAAASSPAFLQPGGGPPCTPGLDQTCNDDPALSSLRGTCSPAAKCVCRDSVALNQVTGRCQ